MAWIPITIGLFVGKLILDALEKSAGKSRREWSTRRDELIEQIRESEDRLRRELDQIKATRNFYQLKELYKVSIETADQAYNFLGSAIQSINALKIARGSIEIETRRIIQQKRNTVDSLQKDKFEEEVKQFQEILLHINTDINTLYEEKADFLSKVKSLNLQTSKFKEHIRDNCGFDGKFWYARVEQRKTQKKLMQK